MRAHTAVVVASLLALTGAPAANAQDAAEVGIEAYDASSGPRLSINTTEIDFGEVDDSKIVSKLVTITNTGDEDLVIGNVTVTCGCTTGEVEKDTLKPGESTELDIQFNPQRRSGEQHGKRVTIESNDPTGSTSVGLSVWVLPRVIATPGIASFGRVQQGETKTTQLTVMGLTEDFKILSAAVDRDDSFQVRIVEQSVIDREHPRTGESLKVGMAVLEVSMTEQARIGRVDGSIRIETNDETTAVLTIRITAGVAGDISTAPSRIALGALTPGDTFSQTFKVLSEKGNQFNLKKARLVTSTMSGEDRDTIGISYEPLPSDTSEVGFLVTISGQATDTMRIIQGNLVLLTDAPGQKIIRIPINGVVRAQTAGG